jgi:hypothetical protein
VKRFRGPGVDGFTRVTAKPFLDGVSQDQVDARVSGVFHGEAPEEFLENWHFTLRRQRIQDD